MLISIERPSLELTETYTIFVRKIVFKLTYMRFYTKVIFIMYNFF